MKPEERMDEPGHMLKCLRRIHAAYDAAGNDLSAWPAAAATEIEKLADALMARERDARRYRWLRDIGNAEWAPFGLCYGYRGEKADAAIDAAIIKQFMGMNDDA